MKSGNLRKLSVLLLLALVPAALCLAADVTTRGGIEEELAGKITSYAERKMEELHTPGLGVGVVYGNTLVYEGFFGVMNVDTGEAVSKDTLFRIGSISKSVTAIGLMQKWEEGVFKLDDPVNDYLPEPLIHSPDPKKPVTFRHVLTHTSGAGEFLSFKQLLMKGQGVQVEGDDYKPLYEYLKLGFNNKVEPGVKYAYSNYGYTLLGYALENMAGEPFHVHMKKSVFAKLGMNDTCYRHTDELEPRIITGHSWKDKKGEYTVKKHRAFGITPSGNIYTTVEDFSLYVAALLNGGKNKNGRVIGEDTLAMMMTRQHTFDERQPGYGFGFRIYGDEVWGEHRIVGHSGSVPFGYTSQLVTAPDKRIGVYVFANSDEYAPKQIGFGIMKMILGGKKEELTRTVPDEEMMTSLTGYYGPKYTNFKTSTRIYMGGIGTYRVDRKDGNLVLYGTWEGKDEARNLYQVDPDDPYFYWIEQDDEDDVYGTHSYITFYERDGNMYISPGGFDEYVRLGPVRTMKSVLMIPAGRVLAEINPF